VDRFHLLCQQLLTADPTGVVRDIQWLPMNYN
jgi:hypothetical protein